MVLELVYFGLILFLVYVYGIIPFILIKKQLPINPFTPLFVGYACLGILSQWFFISGAINFFVFLVLVVGALVAIWRYAFYFKAHVQNLKNCLKSLSYQQRISIALMLLVIAYQSAIPTKINDLGMYYLQTLQWMEKYGAVAGLGNLHPALGLGSAWHSFLAMLDFMHTDSYGQNGETIRFLGINGSLVLSLFLFLLVEIKSVKNSSKWFLIAFAILAMPLGFLYLTAPSPDLPIIYFTALLIYWFLIEKDQVPLVIFVLLACFVYACKPPSLVAVVLSVWILLLQLRSSSEKWGIKVKKISWALLMAIVCLSPVIYKNLLQTGYPVYPAPYGAKILSHQLNNLSPTISKAQIPEDWNEAYRKGVVTWGLNDSSTKQIFISDTQVKKSRIQSWLTRPGYKGFMNKLIFLNAFLTCILVFASLFLFKRNSNSLSLQILFAAPLVLIVISFFDWYLLSQYRLMLPTALALFSCNVLIVHSLFSNYLANWVLPIVIKKNVVLLFPLLFCVLAFVPLSAFKESSRNKDITQSRGFTPNYLLLPYGQYTTFEPIDSFQVDSQYFYFYPHKAYAWDCPIPAVSPGQQHFVQEVFNYQFHANSSNPQDGFYLQKK